MITGPRETGAVLPYRQFGSVGPGGCARHVPDGVAARPARFPYPQSSTTLPLDPPCIAEMAWGVGLAPTLRACKNPVDESFFELTIPTGIHQLVHATVQVRNTCESAPSLAPAAGRRIRMKEHLECALHFYKVLHAAVCAVNSFRRSPRAIA